MIAKRIELDYFRNYLHLETDFHPEVNVIYGDNAQGKTNLLEAIAYLSSARSHRARYDKEMIRFDTDSAFIKTNVVSGQREYELEAQLYRGKRRILYSNGVRLKTAGELSGILKTVLFCPEDLYLIKESAAERRKFLDNAICQLRPKYASALAEYNRLYEHKIRILKDSEEYPSLLDTLDDFNLRLAQMGSILVHYRAHYVKRLMETAPIIHKDFSGGSEDLGLEYVTVSTVTDPLAGQKVIFEQILEHQEQHREAEIASRSCLTGPHKDDLVVTIHGVSVKTYGSQGQTRTAALSLKLAEREIIFDECGEYPILLLDDVLSELDPKRQEFVLNRIKGGQVFISCCEDDRLEGLQKGKTIHIQDGKIIK